ncbi:hypothetical protein [Mesorhizobium sp.]|uniref:hypothetical protein n=1 Tax=Mesorhizobium sp. TaxID=1871066 RepID=UPI00344F2693
MAKHAARRIGILDDKQEASGPGRRVLPLQGRRQVASVADIGLGNGLPGFKGWALKRESHAGTPCSIAFFSKKIDKRSLLGSVERNRGWFLGNVGRRREFQHHAPPTALDECSQVELSPLEKLPGRKRRRPYPAKELAGRHKSR